MTASCQTCKTLLLGLLVVWAVASMVIIAVWASQPEATPATPCDQQLEEVTEKLKGAKVVWGMNKVALEEMVEELRENQTQQQDRLQTLETGLALSARRLEVCHNLQAVLHGNISSLEEQLQQQEEVQRNLSSLVSQQLEEMEALQQNVTEAAHLTASYISLNQAAESQSEAAHSQTRACISSKTYLERRLSRCKEEEHHSSEQSAESASCSPSSSSPSSSSASSSSSPPAVWLLTLPACWVLHLLLHLLSCSSSPAI